MKLIYIAGPFSAPDRVGVEENINKAQLAGLEVAKLGHMPVIPHSNTSLPEFELVQPYEFWIEGTMRLLHVCDEVYAIPGWEKSRGARAEVIEARRLKMVVHTDLADLSRVVES